MRGSDERTGSLFSHVDLEDRIPSKPPLRLIRRIVNEVLAGLDGEFAALCSDEGRPSIAPERLIRASLLQILFSVRSERPLMEQPTESATRDRRTGWSTSTANRQNANQALPARNDPDTSDARQIP